MANLGSIFPIISVVASAITYTSGAPDKDKLESKPTLGSNVISTKKENALSPEITKPPRATTTEGHKVKTLECFCRVYDDGTTEWKLVLSNGVAQYQKITNKLYRGYNSWRLPDNTYRMNYYVVDENGYQRLRQEFGNQPPVLPPYVPHVPRV